MKFTKITKYSILALALSTLTFAGQDWYHDRDARYRGGDGWHAHVFSDVRSDLDHIYTAGAASDKERRRLDRTKEELVALQAKLDQGVFDNGTVNDVIDSLRKSSNDDKLGPQDRQVLADDAERIHAYQKNYTHWKH